MIQNYTKWHIRNLKYKSIAVPGRFGPESFRPWVVSARVFLFFLSFFLPIRLNLRGGHQTGFNARNKSLTAKLLQQGYRCHKLRKTFSKFYCRHYE